MGGWGRGNGRGGGGGGGGGGGDKTGCGKRVKCLFLDRFLAHRAIRRLLVQRVNRVFHL